MQTSSPSSLQLPAPGPRLPTPDFEAEIGALLAELSNVQSELLGVLQEKRDALAAGKLQMLAELPPREEQLAQRLQQCHQRRSQLLAAARQEGLPSENVGKLATKVNGGKAGELGRRVKETTARMRLLQHHSLANWVLAQQSLLHVSQLLEIIATGGRMRPTYGDKESVHARGSLVNQQA
jgi:flagellar biosynthesis/type III secretory pathway chaperone